jgi:hypothetical protein
LGENVVEKPAAQSYWFGPKTIGFGTGPTSWQGWLLTLAFVVFVIGAVWVSRYISNRTIAIAFDAIAPIAALAVYLWLAGKHTDPNSEF